MYRLAWTAAGAIALGCHEPLPDPPTIPEGDGGAGGSERIELSLDPPSGPDAAAPVVRFRVRLPGGSPDTPEDLMLFEGEIGAYHLGRIQRDDLPSTLTERQVPAQAWVEPEDGLFVVAPERVLEAGERYSLVSRAAGLVGTVRVRQGEVVPMLPRVWPPAEAECGAEQIVFCGGPVVLSEPIDVLFDPGPVRARLQPGADRSDVAGGECCHARLTDVPDDVAALVAPVLAFGVAFDPTPLRLGECEPFVAPVCTAPQQPFGLGCGEVQDDRVIVHGPVQPTLWLIGEPVRMVKPLGASATLVVRGLVPETDYAFEGAVLDLGGQRHPLSERVRTGTALPRVVLSEVLANAAGPEPQQEWVELFNDGASAVDLEGWVLEDVGGETVLPQFVLLPGAYAVVVSEQFEVDPEVDVPPADGAALVRVPRLGKQGLSNAGELLRLRTPDGSIVSRFPALPHPQGGVSRARRDPWTTDDDPEGFGVHAPPGASPGAPNQVL